MRTIANQVDIEFNATVNDKQVDELLNKLKKIEASGVIDLKNVGADIKSAKKELQDLQNEIKKVNDLKGKKGSVDGGAKEQEKVNKNIIEQEKAKQQIIAAQNQGLHTTEKLAARYLKTLKDEGEVTQEQWSRLKTISELEKQRLRTYEYYAKVSKEKEAQTQNQLKLEQDRLTKIEELRRKVGKSDLGKDDRANVTKDLYILEKRLSSENWDNEYKLAKENFDDRVKFLKQYTALSEKETKEKAALEKKENERISKIKEERALKLNAMQFEKSAPLQQMAKMYAEDERVAKEQQNLMNKKHTEALAMDKARTAEKMAMEKAHSGAIIENKKREVSRNEQLEKIKLSLIKTNLDKQYMEEFKLLEKKKNLTQKEINDFKKKVDTKIAMQQGERANFTEDISNLMFYRQVGNYVIRTAKNFEKFEDSLFQTGIVAGRSAMEIRAMRNEVLEMGLDIPRTTQDILDNITAVQRTGRSYEEASQIINKSAKLAVASGESIALSTDVLNKALIAFNINVSDTAKVMNIFHSASIRSPLDLKKISDGLKNSASSMRNFIESTDKSGQELEDYKIRILGMTTALLAGQSALGRQASSSGMSIRTLGTKLINLEKSAKKLLDTQLELNSVMIKGDKIVRDGSGGVQLTSDYITQLAQNDLPRAIELLSELYKTGEITTQTLSKMLTGRQAPYLIAQLGIINGSMDNYIKRFTTGYEVTEDYEQAIQSWSSEMKKARNSMMLLNSSVAGFMDTIGSTALSVFNNLVKNMNDFKKSLGGTGVALSALSDALLAVAFASLAKNLTLLTLKFSGVAKVISAATVSLKAFAATLLSVKALLGIAFIAGTAIYAYNKRINDQLILEENTRKRIKKEINDSLNVLGMQLTILENQQRTMQDLVSYDLTKNFDGTYDVLDRIVEKMSEFVKMLEVTSKLKTFQMPELNSPDTFFREIESSNIKRYNEEFKEFLDNAPSIAVELKKIDDIYKNQIKNIGTVVASQSIYRKKAREELGIKNLKQEESREYEVRLNIEKQFQEQKNKLIEDYDKKNRETFNKNSKYYESTQLKNMKVTTDMLESISNFDLDSGKFLNDYFLDIGDSFLGVFEKLGTGKAFNFFTEMYENKKITAESYSSIIKVVDERYKLENDNLEKVNKSMIDYINNLEQVNKFIVGQKVEIFDKFVKSEDIKSVSQYSQAMQKFGIISKGTTNEMTELEDSMKELNVSTTMQDLFKTGKLMETVTVFKSINTSIDDMTKSIEYFDTKMADSSLTEEQKAIYETSKKNAQTTKDNMEGLLKMFVRGIDYQEKSNEKSTFYYDMTKKMSLEAQQIGLEELALLQNKRDILSEEMKISKSKYEFDKKSASSILDDTKRTIDSIKESIKVRQEGATDEEELKRVITANKEIERLTQKQIKLESLLGDTSLENLLIEKARLETKLENKEIIAGSDEEDYLKLIIALIQIETQRQQELNNEKKTGLEYTADEAAIIKARNKALDDYISNLEKLKNTNETMQDLEKKLGGRGRLQIESEINKEIEAQAIRRKNNLKIDEKGSKEKIDRLTQELKDADALEKMYERMGELSFEKQNLNKSTLDNLKSELNYLEYLKSGETDKLKLAELDLEIAKSKKQIVLEENNILMDRIGILSNIMSKFGDMGGLFGGAISGAGGLFKKDAKTELNAFQTMMGGGVNGFFSSLNIGMTAFDIANSFWKHTQAQKEAKRQEEAAKRDAERNRLLKASKDTLQNSLSGLDYTSISRSVAQSFVNAFSKDLYINEKTIGKSNLGSINDIKDFRDSIKVEQIMTDRDKGYYILKETGEKITEATYVRLDNLGTQADKILKVIEENQSEMFSTNFGFDLQAIEDSDGNIVDYITNGWSKASDIIKKMQGDALEGLNEINSYLGTDFVTTTSNALISNNKNISDSTDRLQEKYGKLSERIRVGLDMGVPIQKNTQLGQIVDGVFQVYDTLPNIVKSIVDEAKILEAEQTKVNEDAEYLKQLWIDAGGAIADMDDALSDLDNSILDTLSKGLISQDSKGMIDEFGSLITDSITKQFRDSEAINKSFQFFGDLVKSAISTGDIGEFEAIYKQLTTNLDYVNAQELSRIGMSAEHIKQLETWQEIYKVINKLEEENMNLWERRDALMDKANTIFKDTITSVSDIYVNSKKTADLWSKEMNNGIEKVKENIDKANDLTKKIEVNSKSFLKEWIKDGNKMSDVIDMMSDNMKSLYDSTLEFLDSKNYVEASSKLGSDLAGSLIKSYQKELLDTKYANQFMLLSDKFGAALASGSLSNIQALNNEIQKFAVQSEQERLKFDAIRDLFSLDNNIAYNQADQNITYETGSTKSNVYNYYNTVDITGTFIADKVTVRKLTDEIVKYLPDSMKNNNVRG